MSSRYDRRPPARPTYRHEEPEDYRAVVELSDIPAVLTEDPATCARFLHHYFTKATHCAVEDVRLVSSQEPPVRPLEAGEIARPARPMYRMTLTERDAWERLRRASDPPPSRRGGFEEPSDTSLLWDHEIISKHVPGWCAISKVQGGGTVSSIKDKLYARKLKFRLVRTEVTEELPARVFLSQSNGYGSSSGRRGSNTSAPGRGHVDEDAPIPYSPPGPASPIPYAPFGSPKDRRPLSWEVTDPAVAAADGAGGDAGLSRSTSTRSAGPREEERRRPEYRLTEDYVGHRHHDAESDPWRDREPDMRKSPAEENFRWLERHRKYLLATQVGTQLPTTIPGFPPGRTIVTWQLAKFITRRHLALFFSQFGRVDDVKIRQIPEGWSPAGRIAYIAFMSSRECSAVLNKLHGINFPKWIDALRESNRYWMEYDDFSRGAQGYLLVAEAVEDEWCPIASKLVNGKLDPSFKPIKALPRPKPPAAAPSAPRSDRAGDALDYGAFDEPPPSSRSRATRAAQASTAEPRTRSRERPRSQTPRAEIKITLPVLFPDKVVQPESGEQSPGGARGEGHRRMKVLALPRGARVHELRLLLAQYGTTQIAELAATPNEVTRVIFNSLPPKQRAAAAAQRTETRGKFANCFELPVSLRDLEPEQVAIWSIWKWKDDEGPRAARLAEPPRASDETPATSDAMNLTLTAVPDKDPQADSIDAVATMDEVDAYLDNGILPSGERTAPPPPSRPASVSERSSSRPHADTASTRPAQPTQQEAPPSAHPSMSTSNQPVPNRLKRGKPKANALALLMANQPDMAPPDGGSVDSATTDGTTSAKKRRFE